MLAENCKKNVNYLRIIAVLRFLRDGGDITHDEYARAKKYYLKLTGADIALVD